MQWKAYRYLTATLRIVTLLALCLVMLPAHAERVRELASFAGVRDNQLVGYGLVVGLDGSGDQTTQAPFTSQSLTNMLSQLGVTVPPGTNLQLRNVAAVMVTADLPPFSRPGQRLDIVVSSIANASSLRGGTLLMTPLKGADGDTYAIAQGNMLVGGAGAQAGGSSVQINQQASGRIPNGALVEREVPLNLGGNGGVLELQLNDADFGTVQRMVSAINSEFGQSVAYARNGRVIALDGPMDANDRVNFMARVENVQVTPTEAPAKVVLNARTGSVVMNSAVTLRRAAVAHGNLSIMIDTQFGVSQPNPLGQGDTVVVPDADINIEQQEAYLQIVEGADLAEVVNALNALGATPQDLMSILEALRASGSLRAELEII
ncbi:MULTISPECIES: flagellar basal body P-ring protein FlgI [Halomonadaceae]|jgi:flagellar P-ring protein precursor FlgI|uniref:Flagellar P-ring protein n=2 Tax=Vreelandella piezotolerans TaxID=2609667 RepID=A0ABQ6X9D1_9GAMM|nr:MULTISPECIES: flagellar basal body P-ring protein FlgI [Halomonas]KFC50704.1 flagellar P-ring protein FlgI [Halomonas sp. SUBG004]KAE8438624.1 flagellar basal body P-ring protein FlgI [Halomonas piezotolerans]MCG7576835.1 flagellar basal body P-ring protein FlgI [Halomonas sp. MMH1-48]MCG7603898.1 flagellar basal body P-ring protein FlgI [Halomonas sp. MM17-34]MCG7613294.1 flagellar basal body P-ring protein FlgI [Halomonas sp. MM17-29]